MLVISFYNVCMTGKQQNCDPIQLNGNNQLRIVQDVLDHMHNTVQVIHTFPVIL